MLCLAIALSVRPASGEEVRAGSNVSSTTQLSEWARFFGTDMRELETQAYSTTYYDPATTRPVVIDGVTIDLVAASPVETEAKIRTITRQGDPEFGTIRVESVSTTGRGDVVKLDYTLGQRSLDAPIVVGPLDGLEVTPPAHREVVGGKTFVFRSVSRNTEIAALLVAPSFEDLLAKRNLREVRERGARLETGSLRVLSADGKPVGYFAGDVRIAHGEDYVSLAP
jgi:hypothetical protein